MNIGEPRKVREIEPVDVPVPSDVPAEEPVVVPVPEERPAGGACVTRLGSPLP